MEHLNKAQIVLLTLFVSFVASMATGIVVVTLMQQSPEPVAQTITKVIERTIEKVTPTFVDKPGKQVIITVGALWRLNLWDKKETSSRWELGQSSLLTALL
jgi:hypothetical protein